MWSWHSSINPILYNLTQLDIISLCILWCIPAVILGFSIVIYLASSWPLYFWFSSFPEMYKEHMKNTCDKLYLHCTVVCWA